MNIARLSEDFSVTGQISPDELGVIAAKGFKTIFCHRPDGEGEGQPDVMSITKAAKANGLDVVYLPVVPGKMGQTEVDAFTRKYDQMDKPILGYCRSGKRAMSLWTMSQAEQKTLEELQTVAAEAQYNYQIWHDAMNLANMKISQLQEEVKRRQSEASK